MARLRRNAFNGQTAHIPALARMLKGYGADIATGIEAEDWSLG
ncbi:MAG TPA: hypothetical protein VFG05_12540 [Methylocella sp.]|nr:hypothetical protein [Methylocella sp.]